MITRIMVFAAALAAAGIATNLIPKQIPAEYSEAALEQILPNEIDGKGYEPGPVPGSTYKMDKDTYDKLHPYGIVARVFPFNGIRYDTTIIAGGSPDNFHDPTWCLPGQGWELGTRQETTVHTQSRGEVPVSFFPATNSRDHRQMIVMYTFKGPGSFHAGITPLTLDMWTHDFAEAKSHTGAFYRFLNIDGNPDLDTMKHFVATYLDTAKVSSKGAF